MAKIGQIGINPYLTAQLKSDNKEKGKTEKSNKAGKSFFSTMIEPQSVGDERLPVEATELLSLDNPEVLESLIDHLFESGDALKRNPVEERLEEYKNNIRILINYVSSKSYQVIREKGVMNPRTFKQKEFVNIELIDKKLDSLAVYILSRQSNQMEILKRVDEINGLIINVVR